MDFGKIWDKYGIYIALMFMMLMMFSYSIEWLRVGVGQGIDGAFAPFVDGFKIPFYILIVILSAFTGIVLLDHPEVYHRLREDDGVSGKDEGVPDRVPRSPALPG